MPLTTPHGMKTCNTIFIDATYADARTPSRHSVGPPRAESVAVRSIQRPPTRPNIRSAFLTRDDGRLQYHHPGPRSGKSLSQAAARKEHERIRCDHRPLKRPVQRDSDAQLPSFTPTMSEIYARDHQMAARQCFGNFMEGVISLQLRKRFDKVAALILTTSSHQRPPSHVNLLHPLLGLGRRLLVRGIGQTEQRTQWIHVAGRTLVRRCRQDQGRHFVEA
ncbi:hypothetical protein E4U35_008275 [Claviceps purpurea]|nr:hypothetical protein E4U35_008275 [Claviceps purpurea]